MKRQMLEHPYRVLSALNESEQSRELLEFAEFLGFDQSQVMAICTGFVEEGFVLIEEQEFQEVSLAPEGQELVSSKTPLLERRVAEALRDSGSAMTTPELAQALEVSAQEIGKVLRFLMSKRYAKKDGKSVVWADADLKEVHLDEEILQRLSDAEKMIQLGAEEAKPKAMQQALKALRSRGFIKVKSRKRRSVGITDAGRNLLKDGVDPIREVNQLTEAMLLSGDWKNVKFREYDVELEAAPIHPGKTHPLRRVLEETRRAFLAMGFEEIRGEYVESAFWDFDALFQPQDHPARDMQDTFYCGRPNRFSLPDKEMVETIRRTHEEGGDTGSTGWRYKWSEEKARQVVLRTHTTAVTVAACHENPAPPQKLFCVGRVFRRETIDYKHLPEFHQVDGIIVEKNASFANLLGTLKEFYRLMGFNEVKFRPAFFPYTEPSVEVFVRMPGRKEWFELGGAGIFRPEVTRPAGVSVPVLAWGLGLERLAMIRYQIHDIRQLYLSQLNWLKENALCR